MLDDKNFNKQKILDRLAKAQNLADRATNDNESFAAAAAVQRILLEYNLTMDDIPGEKLDQEIVAEFVAMGYKDTFSGILSYALSKNYFCGALWTQVYDGNENVVPALRFIGRKENVQTVIYMFTNLRMRAMVFANQEFTKYKNSVQSPQHGKAWKASFLAGFVSGLNAKFAAERIQATNTSMALVVQNTTKEINNWMLEHDGKIYGSKHTKFSTNFNGAAYNRGQEVGRNIDLQKSINTNNQLRLGN